MTFPIFADADVHIFLSATAKYSLHRRILIHNSPTLARLLVVEHAVAMPSTFGEEDKVTEWLLYLKYPPNNSSFEGSGELVTTVSKEDDLLSRYCR